MWRVATCVCLAIFLPAGAQARKPRCTLRVHVEANANDSESFATPMHSQVTGKKIVIEKVPRISEQDVVAFYPYPAADGSYGILFKLTDHGKLALDTLSVERRGRFVYVFVNSRPLAELQIDRRVNDGQLYVASGVTAADLELMKKQWRILGQGKRPRSR